MLPVSSGLPALPSVGITVKTRRNPSRLLRSFETEVRSLLLTLWKSLSTGANVPIT